MYCYHVDSSYRCCLLYSFSSLVLAMQSVSTPSAHQVQALTQQHSPPGDDTPAPAPAPAATPPPTLDLAHAALAVIDPVRDVLTARTAPRAVLEAACVAVGCVATWVGSRHGAALQELLPVVVELANSADDASVRAAGLAALAACIRCVLLGCFGWGGVVDV